MDRQTDKHTDGRTDGYWDSMTDPAQRAESLKTLYQPMKGCLHASQVLPSPNI